MADYKIVVTTDALIPVTDPFESWSQIDCTPTFNAVGTGSFTHPADPRLIAALTPGNRVAVYRDGAVLMAGPIEKPGQIKRSTTDANSYGQGQVTVTFADNMAPVVSCLAYPDPAHDVTAQATDYYTVTAGDPQVALRNLVNLNAGPGAIPRRRVPGLVLGPLATGLTGTTPVTYAARFDNLGDLMRTVAASGGGLGFRVDEIAGKLVYTVYQPRDRSKSVVFSWDLHNLVDLTTDPEAPTATVAIVGGDGTGSSRTFVERTNDDALGAGWPRTEVFVNASGTTDITGLQQAGDAALAQAAEKVGLTATAVDGPGCRFGVDYFLGDKVGVVLANDVLFVDVVQSVHITATPDAGEVITPAIGSSDPHTDTPTVVVIRDMLARLARLERQ